MIANWINKPSDFKKHNRKAKTWRVLLTQKALLHQSHLSIILSALDPDSTVGTVPLPLEIPNISLIMGTPTLAHVAKLLFSSHEVFFSRRAAVGMSWKSALETLFFHIYVHVTRRDIGAHMTS